MVRASRKRTNLSDSTDLGALNQCFDEAMCAEKSACLWANITALQCPPCCPSVCHTGPSSERWPDGIPVGLARSRVANTTTLPHVLTWCRMPDLIGSRVTRTDGPIRLHRSRSTESVLQRSYVCRKGRSPVRLYAGTDVPLLLSIRAPPKSLWRALARR